MKSSVEMPKTKEESIALSEKLGKMYSDLDKIKKEIADHEYAIERAPSYQLPSNHKPSEYTWKFVPWEITLFFVVGFICFLASVLMSVENFRRAMQDVPGRQILIPAKIILLLPPVSVLIMHFFVSRYGKKRAREENEKSNREMEKNVLRRDVLKNELIELHDKKYSLHKELSSYDDIVPSDMRQKNRMQMVRKMLDSGEAETFSEAIGMCEKIFSKEK